MQVTETLSDGLKRAFTVVLPSADVEGRRRERLAEIGKTLTLPGFRPGKVPALVISQRFGGTVTAEILGESVQNAVRRVLDDRGLRPATQPNIDLVNQDDVLAPAGLIPDLEFKMDVEVLPEFTLPDFTVIALTELKARVDDETLDRALRNLVRRGRTLVDISAEELGERGAETGEVVLCDYLGRVDGEAFPGGTQADATIEVGGEGFIPGFTEQLAGIKPGEARTINVIFPETYGTKALAGKPAEYEITAKGIKRANQPVIDDAFAESLSFENLDELKAFVNRRIQGEYDQLSRNRMKRELLDRLSELVGFALPSSLVDQEFNQIWARVEAHREAGKLEPEDEAKDEATLRVDYRAIAERRVRLGLLLAEVGRLNNIGVTQEELMRAMRAEASKYPGQEGKVLEYFKNNPGAVDGLRGPIYEEKAIDWVIGQTQITERIVTPDELAAEPDETAAAAVSEPEAPGVPAAKETTPEVAPEVTPEAPVE